MLDFLNLPSSSLLSYADQAGDKVGGVKWASAYKTGLTLTETPVALNAKDNIRET